MWNVKIEIFEGSFSIYNFCFSYKHINYWNISEHPVPPSPNFRACSLVSFYTKSAS